MTDVFISYCSADRERVGVIAQALEKEGLDVWWDRALIAGSSYEAEIDKALSAAKAVIVVWSPASVVSDWVRSESDGARAGGKLVPVLIEACRVPRPFDRLHTIDLTAWKGDRGNQGFPETVEAVKAIVEGRVARPVPWRRRLTLAAIGSAIVGAVVLVSALTGIVDAALRWSQPGAFASSEADRLGGDEVSPETQEGFRAALDELARSSDLRTQRALTLLERSDSRGEALAALESLATDQSSAIDGQMRRTASLWRQIGLLQFNESPPLARAALEKSRRYNPNDATTLTALGALYQREGRIAEADEVYRIVLSRGTLDASAEGRALQVVGQAHLERGELAAAQRAFDRALSLSRDAVDEPLEADLQIDFGALEIERGNTMGARAHFREGRDFALALDYQESANYADYNIAETFVIDGNLERAEAMLRSAAQTATAQSDSYLALFIDLAMARISARRGQTDRALSIAEDVRTRAVNAEVRRAELVALLEIAEAKLEMRRYGEAEQAAVRAVEGFRTLRASSSLQIASALRDIALSHDQTRAQSACASLATLVSAGNAEREIARLRRLSACA